MKTVLLSSADASCVMNLHCELTASFWGTFAGEHRKEVAAGTGITENTAILTRKAIMHCYSTNPAAESYRGAKAPVKGIRSLNLSCHLATRGKSAQDLSKDMVNCILH